MVFFGGDGQPLHIAVANGFPPEVYLPIARPLIRDYFVFSLPPRPLWEPAPRPESITTWSELAMDLLAGLNQQGIAHTIALGHSFGGTISLMAAVHAPERFRALVLLDPTIFDQARIRAMTQAQAAGGYNNPLAERTQRRRSRFASPDEGMAYWRTRPLFEGWPEPALRLYTQGALVPAPDGRGLVLRWTPEWEARCYAVAHMDAWPLVEALPAELPVLVVRGAATNVFTEAAAAQLRAVRPQTTIRTLEGGHLFPMTAPAETVAVVQTWLAAQGI